MNNLSVIVPSKTVSNLIPCIEAIRSAGESGRVIVVDDGISWDGSPVASQPGDLICQGADPFIFSRNVNLGIHAAGEDDVVLLNDDTILTTPSGFSAMQRSLEEHKDYGVLSAAVNNVGNVNQHPHGPWIFDEKSAKNWPCDVHRQARPSEAEIPIRDEPRTLCFIAVLIPRRVIDLVGLLDEEFVGYGLEDDSYCLRVRRAGLKLGIFDGCFVDHSKLRSSFRGGPSDAGDFRPNMKIFIQKYGMDNWGRDRRTSPYRDLFPPEVLR